MVRPVTIFDVSGSSSGVPKSPSRPSSSSSSNARGRELERSIPRSSSSSGAPAGGCNRFIGKITALKKGTPPGIHEEAMNILGRVAAQVEPIMRKRGWRVSHLAEFCPKDRRLLGMNVNVGEKILIRLRNSQKSTTIMPYEAVLGTMLHELAHMQVGPHNKKFHALLDELTAECEELMIKGVNYEGVNHVPYAGNGHRLGGSRPASARVAAATAADKRKRNSELYGSMLGGIKLGRGSSHSCGVSPRTLRQNAAERRRRSATSCTVIVDGCCSREDGRKAKSRIVHIIDSSPAGANNANRSRRPFWPCPVCTLHNKELWLVCDACGSEKPDDAEKQGASSASSLHPRKKAKQGSGNSAASPIVL